MQFGTAVAQSTLRLSGGAQASGDLTEETSIEKPKKRRISGAALGVTKHEAYYQALSLGGGTRVSAFLAGKARIDRQMAYPATKHKVKAAVAAAWSGYGE